MNIHKTLNSSKKTTWFIFVVILFMQPIILSSANLNDSKKPIPIIKHLNNFEKKFNVYFSYDEKLLTPIKVKLKLKKDEKLESALNRLLKSTDLNYKSFNSKYYVIYKNSADKNINTNYIEKHLDKIKAKKHHSNGNNLLLAAQMMVNGIVTTVSGEPLPGVNIIAVENNALGAISNFDGKYSININKNVKSLEFSSIGFKTQLVSINNRTTINIVLKENFQELNEVILTAVGIESNKASLGYAIQNVKAKEITNTGEFDVVSSLSSKIPGVQVTSASGEPGAASNIRIRGNSSVLGNNSPLFIVDGIPIDNSQIKRGDDRESIGGVNQSNRAIDLNPNDIQNLTVLKGPAATVLYGIRAANGAIVIKTRGGFNGESKINFSSSINFSKVTATPSRQNTYAKGANIDPNGPLPFINLYTDGPPFSWGPRINQLEYDGDSSFPYDSRGRLVPVGTGNGKPAQAVTDLYDKFYTTGISIDNHLSVSGGTENLNFYTSIGNLKQTGTQRNTDFSRTSLRGNIFGQITKKLGLYVSLYYANSGSDNKALRGQNRSGQGVGLYFNATTFDPSAGLSGSQAWRTASSYTTPDGMRRAQEFDNPYFNVARNVNSDKVNRFIGSFSPEYQISNTLKLVYRLGWDYYTDEQLQFYDIGAFEAGYAGSIRKLNISSSNINSDLLLFFKKKFSDNFKIDAVLGHNYFKSKSAVNGLRGAPLGTAGFISLSNAQDIVETFDEEVNKELAGVFADIKVNIKNILYLNLSGRNDWSSTLPKGNNSIFYPSISLGLNAGKALSVNNNSILSYAKLRTSWGKVGNDAPPYATNTTFKIGQVGGDSETRDYALPFLGISGFELNNIEGNNNLKPEQSSTFEIGGDFKLFKSKLNFDISYYNSETTNQILPVTISAGSGFTSQIANAGTVSNKGLEIGLDFTSIELTNFTWNISANFTTNKSKVVELAPNVNNVALNFSIQGEVFSSATVGQPFGAIIGTKYLRDNKGNIIISADGYPIEDTQIGVVGNPNPDWLAGIRNIFTYKNFSLSTLLDIRKGGDLWNGTKGIMNGFGVGAETAIREQTTVFKGVLSDGTVNTKEVPYIAPGNSPTFLRAYWFKYGIAHVTEENIEEVNWVRLRELSVTYSFPKKLFKGLLKGSSISFIGRNLWLSTNYTGIDPEVSQASQSNASGIDYLNSPNTKSYGFKLHLIF
ncbi:MAG: SusC/RagA family TonB-linked outer membrane protein [Tenacibaculum sp.]